MRPGLVVVGLVLLPALAGGLQGQLFSSSDAADAAERLTGQRAHMGGGVQRLAGGRLQGPAVTLGLVRDDRASLEEEGLKAIKVFEQAQPGSVIVVCLDGDKNFAVFGATFATLAKGRRLGGIVTDGSMRGIADLRRIAVPIFARGTVPGSAGAHYRLASVNQPVVCDGARVQPGDMIIGDDDGVAVVPAASSAAVFANARRLRAEKESLLPLIAKHSSYTKAVEELRRRRPPR